MLMFGSLPLGVLSSVRKYAIWVLIMGPLILIGMTLLCLGGILRVDLTVPIVGPAITRVCVNQEFTISLYIAIFFFVQSIR